MNLTLENCSYLLTGSGSNSALIDNEIVFHQTGFPFIPARRIKGLLRESLTEVTEIIGDDDYTLCNKLFGVEGNALENGGLIRIGNGYLENWQDILKEAGEYPQTLTKENIIVYFTSEITQTSIEGKTGTTKLHSLRNYRVLNPGYRFIFPISFKEEINESESQKFRKAVWNLRYMGTRRNRGFGKVKCSLDTTNESINSNTAIQMHTPEGSFKIKVIARNIDPLILSKTDSDQNTVGSYINISGNKLRGLLVSQYIKNYGKIKDDDFLFWELFLSGKIHYSNLTLGGSTPISLNIHHPKDQEDILLDVFTLEKDNKTITKPITGFGKFSFTDNNVEISKIKPEFTSQFHVSRGKDRIAGTSTKEEGSIFYYTALQEHQEFIGEITGEQESLKKLTEGLPSPLIGFIGKSKSAQYGKVELTFSIEESQRSTTKYSSNRFLLKFNSPVLLFNEIGFPNPSESTLKEYLKDTLKVRDVDKIKITNRAVSFTHIEQFNVSWNAKTEKIPAYDAGCVFEIVIEEDNLIENLAVLKNVGIGEMRNIGFGRVDLEKINNNSKYTKKESSNKNQAPEINSEPQNALLKNIYSQIKKVEEIDKIKTEAIKCAIAFKPKYKGNLTSHLLGIMIEVFKEAKQGKHDLKEYGFVKDWLEKAGKLNGSNSKIKKKKEPKPAFKSLLKAHLIDEDNIEQSKLLNAYLDFNKGYVYWVTFFQTVQKLNRNER